MTIINIDQKSGHAVCVREVSGTERVLAPEALRFLTELHRAFADQIDALLKARKCRQHGYDRGELPEYLTETTEIRQGVWEAAPIPAILRDRRVEITGPVDRKMIINALNSGAKVFMADFEDALSPRFDKMIEGQANMLDYSAGQLEFHDNVRERSYTLNDEHALMIIRPRGLHLQEAHLTINEQPIAAALFDFGLHFFHNGAALLAAGRGPFYYLPKLENHREARLWNQIFIWAQDWIGMPQGSIKATVLIETLRSAFEMDEIIWELREHIAGLNCGRWDYVFSYIKTTRCHANYMLPDRSAVTMDRSFLASYAARLVKVCHRRGIHAMGGMAAQIPVRGDDAANAQAFDNVRADKLREVQMGHDGTCVAHLDLVPVAMEIFDEHMPTANQIKVPRQYHRTDPSKLLEPHTGSVTERGVRTNILVAIEYLAEWLGGRGAVPINNLMEDAATAEICRAQLWHWRAHGAEIRLASGDGNRILDADWLNAMIDEEVDLLSAQAEQRPALAVHLDTATLILRNAVQASALSEFLNTPAYAALNAQPLAAYHSLVAAE